MNSENIKLADDAPRFNIKAVVTQTGLNPATIRAWERRYGFPMPQRTEGGHRQYSQRDIDALKWLITRQDEGISISHAIEMWHSYTERGEDPLQSVSTFVEQPITKAVPLFERPQIDELRQAWISACLALDRAAAEQILANAFASFPPEMVCFELLQYGLSEIGNGWYRGEVTVQQEHFTSAISIQRIELLIAAAPAPTRRERTVLFCAPGDYHVFSLLLLTYLLRQRGFDVIYLGANVPVEELVSTINSVDPVLAIATAQLLYAAAGLKHIALSLQGENIPLAFGGLAFNQIPRLRQLIPGFFLGESLQESLQSALKLILNKPPIPGQVEVSEEYQKALAQFRRRQSLIESHVWGTFIATNKPVEHLAKINDEIGQVIEAALQLGDLGVLTYDVSWIEYLLTSYRLKKETILDYLEAYHQAAQIHLGDDARMIVEWLFTLNADADQ